jgi:hypothetical protein
VFMDGGRVVDSGPVAAVAARQPLFAAMLAGAGGEDGPMAA